MYHNYTRNYNNIFENTESTQYNNLACIAVYKCATYLDLRRSLIYLSTITGAKSMISAN